MSVRRNESEAVGRELAGGGKRKSRSQADMRLVILSWSWILWWEGVRSKVDPKRLSCVPFIVLK